MYMKNKLTLILVFNLSLFSTALAQGRKIDKDPEIKLVIGLVIDQMRWDYLERYKNRFVEGGFKRLMKEGYSFQNTYIPYLPSVTAAGHASIFTGAYPAHHGIIGNDWIERDTEKYMYCTADSRVEPVGGSLKDGKMSPYNLHATTIGDQLKMATNSRSRVYGIAIKDRGSILPAGRSADAAYWFDDSTGGFISSSWYMKELPGWVKSFNENKYASRSLKVGWSTLYPLNSYVQSTPDDMPLERNLGSPKGHTFPYSFNGREDNHYEFRQTPFANTMTLDFAKQLLINEGLGSKKDPDMLCISLSATDYIAHLFGPDAIEVEDTYLRLDKEIENFLHLLDSAIGKNKYTLFLTADHAAPQSAGYAKSRRISAGSLNAYKLKDTLDTYCNSVFGSKGLIVYSEYQFFLNRFVLEKNNLNKNVVADSVVSWLNRRSEILAAFRLDQLYQVNLPKEVSEMIRRGFHLKRSGDIHVVLKAHFSDYLLTGTDHGTVYNYDTHIPLLFFGARINPGETYRKVYMNDIAPTICALLRIQPPDAAFGAVLHEIVR